MDILEEIQNLTYNKNIEEDKTTKVPFKKEKLRITMRYR